MISVGSVQKLTSSPGEREQGTHTEQQPHRPEAGCTIAHGRHRRTPAQVQSDGFARQRQLRRFVQLFRAGQNRVLPELHQRDGLQLALVRAGTVRAGTDRAVLFLLQHYARLSVAGVVVVLLVEHDGIVRLAAAVLFRLTVCQRWRAVDALDVVQTFHLLERLPKVLVFGVVAQIEQPQQPAVAQEPIICRRKRE